MADSFSSPNPGFKRVFEIYHSYVERKANKDGSDDAHAINLANLGVQTAHK